MSLSIYAGIDTKAEQDLSEGKSFLMQCMRRYSCRYVRTLGPHTTDGLSLPTAVAGLSDTSAFGGRGD